MTTLATPVYFPRHTGVPLITVSDTVNVSVALDIGLGTPKIISGNRKSSHVDFRNLRRREALKKQTFMYRIHFWKSVSYFCNNTGFRL